MAAPTKPKPVLEKHYNLKAATEHLGLSDPEDPNDMGGQKWLRDGVNQAENPFPHSRLAGRLVFTESHLIEISMRHENRVHGNTGKRKKRRPARRPLASASDARAA